MNMFGQRFILRYFSSFKPSNNLFSSENAQNFLKNPNNYTESNIDLLQTSLEIIHRDNLKITNKALVSKIISVFSQEFKGLVNKTSASQVSSLLPCMKDLGIISPRIWEIFQEHIIHDFKEMTPLELASIIETCNEAEIGNEMLWLMLEETTLKLIESGVSFPDSSLSKILRGFSKEKKKRTLLRRLTEKIVENMDSMNPKEITSILNTLSYSRLINSQLMSAFINRFDHFKYSITGNSISTFLNCFLKYQAPNHIIEELENMFQSNINSMSLLSLSYTLEVYEQTYGNSIQNNPRKLQFLRNIEKVFVQDKERLHGLFTDDRIYYYSLKIYSKLYNLDLISDYRALKKFLMDPGTKQFSSDEDSKLINDLKKLVRDRI